MATRKSMKLPIVITFLFICIIVYLFTNIKQTVVVCEKTSSFDGDIRLKESITSNMDGKKITSLNVEKRISVPENYSRREKTLWAIKSSLDFTLEYLGGQSASIVSDNYVVSNIEISNNELILLDNISFVDNNGEFGIQINTNTKSSEVIALKVGDSYTDGELKTHLKNHGYSCK